ncbi:MAG: TlpA family protein disulfide reductase [Acidobacteriota bacterium]|nr:TlpA family protein disulfide reductase [Acidobacteriota bacterium]
MSTEVGLKTESTERTPQERVNMLLEEAGKLRFEGQMDAATKELESAMDQARATPYEIEFQTRIRLVMTLSDLYLDRGEIDRALALLAEESAFTERISQIMQATGTPTQRRSAVSGHLQIRDRATQIGLIGRPAPGLSVKRWINGEPVALEDLRGRVVLLEFWATWCKPCQEMFPKLKQLHEEHGERGLEVLALTRHYLAFKGTPEAMEEELQLMRNMIRDHGVEFRVGVAEDEQLQTAYGANGIPTIVLIDRQGLVRYVGPGGEDRRFSETLRAHIHGAQ